MVSVDVKHHVYLLKETTNKQALWFLWTLSTILKEEALNSSATDIVFVTHRIAVETAIA